MKVRREKGAMKKSAHLVGMLIFGILLQGASISLGKEEACAEFSSKDRCIAELKKEYAYYRSEVDVWWQALSDALGRKAASRVKAARRSWLHALQKTCGVRNIDKPGDEKALLCMLKNMHDCLWKLRDTAFRLENGQSVDTWPPCTSR